MSLPFNIPGRVWRRSPANDNNSRRRESRGIRIEELEEEVEQEDSEAQESLGERLRFRIVEQEPRLPVGPVHIKIVDSRRPVASPEPDAFPVKRSEGTGEKKAGVVEHTAQPRGATKAVAPAATKPKRKHTGGRRRTGTLELRGKTWQARLTIEKDGEKLRPWFDLGTDSKPVARRKLRRLLEQTSGGVALPLPGAASKETVDSFTDSWLRSRRARNIASAEYEARYYERIWKPEIGHKQLTAVTALEISAILDEVATGKILPQKRKGQKAEPERYSKQSVSHIRATAFRIFESALAVDLVPKNPVAKIAVPEMDVDDSKPRTVLTDEEIGALIAHPDVDTEIKLLVLISRTVGGLRSGDLNSLDWSAFGPGFEVCKIVRRKTRKKNPHPQPLGVPAPVRPFISAWWEKQGKPTAGPVFPVRRGKRAGEAKKRSNMSYADRLRRELVKAGVLRHELHHETPTSLPVDFHSTRRAYAAALATAGVNEQTAMVLTGHTDSRTHQRYWKSANGLGLLPEKAEPALPAAALTTFVRQTEKAKRPEGETFDLRPTSVFLERDTGLEPVTPSLGSSCSTN